MVIIIPPLFVVNILFQFLVISASQDKVFVDQCIKVMYFDLALNIAIFKNSIQADWIFCKLGQQSLYHITTLQFLRRDT